MRLTILGTGTARPVGDSPQSGVLVEAGETRILFDIGSGVASEVEARMNAADLSGLVRRALPRGPLDRHRAAPIPLPVGRARAAPAARVPPAGRARQARPPRHRDQRATRLLRAGVRDHRVRDRTSGSRSARSVIVPHAVGHYVPAWSMDITGPGGERVVYAGDMGPSEMVVDLARGADLLILEATLENGATDDARRGHIDTAEAIDHVRRAGAPKGLLVHYHSERRADDRAPSAPRPACRSSRPCPGWSSTWSAGASGSPGRPAGYETVRTG